MSFKKLSGKVKLSVSSFSKLMQSGEQTSFRLWLGSFALALFLMGSGAVVAAGPGSLGALAQSGRIKTSPTPPKNQLPPPVDGGKLIGNIPSPLDTLPPLQTLDNKPAPVAEPDTQGTYYGLPRDLFDTVIQPSQITIINTDATKRDITDEDNLVRLLSQKGCDGLKTSIPGLQAWHDQLQNNPAELQRLLGNIKNAITSLIINDKLDEQDTSSPNDPPTWEEILTGIDTHSSDLESLSGQDILNVLEEVIVSAQESYNADCASRATQDTPHFAPIPIPPNPNLNPGFGTEFGDLSGFPPSGPTGQGGSDPCGGRSSQVGPGGTIGCDTGKDTTHINPEDSGLNPSTIPSQDLFGSGSDQGGDGRGGGSDDDQFYDWYPDDSPDAHLVQ